MRGFHGLRGLRGLPGVAVRLRRQEASDNAVTDRGQVDDLDTAGDPVDLVAVPVEVVVDVLTVAHREEQVILRTDVQQQRPEIVADPGRPQPRVSLELLEVQSRALRITPELVLELVDRALFGA